MSINAELASRFARAARMMEVLGEDAFRSSALARAARALEDLPADVAELAKDRARLLAVEGIGPKTADKIIEFVKTGSIEEFDLIKSRVPPGLLDLLELQGLGPKTVAMLWNRAGVLGIPDLKRIIDDGSILKLPRMGAKSVEKLKQAIAFGATVGLRQNIGLVLPLARAIVERISRLPGVGRCAFAGSLRRGKETVGDIDILAEARHAEPIAKAFIELPRVSAVLSAGPGRSSVRMTLDSGASRWGLGDGEGLPSMQVDLKIVPPGRFGAALMYFTGSKEHNIALRERAQRMGLTLNEYGLFKEPPEGQDRPDWAGETPIAADTEEHVYKALGYRQIPPETREASGELDVYELTKPAPPRLVDLADIRAELHAHTTASDGRMSIQELAAKAKERGFHTIAVTDHSRSSAQANGLSVDRLLQHIEDIRKASERVKGIQILAGSEVDILADGTLDYEDKVLRLLDIVVASPHAALTQEPAAATARLLAAVRHPLVHILGHPTGRLINRRPGLSPDMEALIAAAVECNVAMEINAHWMRLDLRDVHARQAVGAGCLIAIDCDVHEAEDFENLEYGILTARRGWVPPEQCPNTWDAPRLRAWLRSKR